MASPIPSGSGGGGSGNTTNAPSTTSSTTPPSSLTPTAEQLVEIDGAVLDYLLYRGFTRSFRTLAADTSNDRLKTFDVDKVIDATFDYVHQYDISSLLDLWSFLDCRLFSHIDAQHTRELHRVKTSLLRYYVVHAVQRGRTDKALEFLVNHTQGLSSSTEVESTWRPWFVLPYLKEPEKDPQFQLYFSPQWLDNFRVSLRNLLSIVLYSLPQPELVSLHAYIRADEQKLKKELTLCRQQLDDKQCEVQKLKERVLSLCTTMKALISFIQDSADKASRGFRSRGTLFETDEVSSNKAREIRAAGTAAAKAANECVVHGQGGGGAPKKKLRRGGQCYGKEAESPSHRQSSVSTSSSSPSFNSSSPDDDLEVELVRRVDDWLSLLYHDMTT